MDIEKERELFDQYFKEKHPELYKDVFNEDGDDRAIIGYSFAWKAWQAAKDESHKQAALYQSEINHLAQANQQWREKAAKAQAVPEKDAVIKKLSDQLYEQEMKASAARVLCETACELLDGYAHQDAMVILNDLEQAMSTGINQ